MSLTAQRNHPAVLDKGLEEVKDNCTRLVACSQMPTNFAEANTTYKLGEVEVADTDFAIANGDSAGATPRKITVAQKTGEVTDDGEATHVAWLDVTGERVLFAHPCTPQVLTDGNPLTFPAHKREILAGIPEPD